MCVGKEEERNVGERPVRKVKTMQEKTRRARETERRENRIEKEWEEERREKKKEKKTEKI